MKEVSKKYLVIADVSTMPYSTATYLFGIFETKDEALQFIKNWKPKRRKSEYDDRPENYNFIKHAKQWIRPDQTLDDALYDQFIEEFDGTPLCTGAYYE